MVHGLVIIALLVSDPAIAPAAPSPPLAADHWRYQAPTGFGHWLLGVAERSAVDLAAVPASIVTWDAAEYALFSATLVLSTLPAIPIGGRSLDAQIQDDLHRWRGPNCDIALATSSFCQPASPSGFRVWTRVSDPIIVTALLAIPSFILLGGALAQEPGLLEAGSLAIEAVLVTQAYHLSIKLLSGREGPLTGTGAGIFHGPSVAYFPDGDPSGHAATFFALAGVYSTYFGLPWLSVLLLGSATALSVMLVVDDSHFASEVVAGAALGYFVGRWVVVHRSSRYRNDALGMPFRLSSVAPLSVRGGSGVAVGFAW